MRITRPLLALTLFFASLLALAQNSTTSLHGTVTDSSGAIVPGAVVTITNKANGLTATAKANDSGVYDFLQIAPGKYDVRTTSAGFGSTILHVELLVSQPATANVTLGAATDVTVDVTSATVTLNTTDATIGNAINNETIMALPSEARNPQTLLALQPGVLFLGSQTDSTESRNGVVSGARADQTNMTLDGVDNNDQIHPSAFTGVLRTSLDATEEFRVTTSDANAEQGRSSGAQVNLVTRAGTNQVHGALYEYNRNTWGVANDWINKSSQLQSGEANRAPRIVRNTYGARLGGPLWKDKIFLFGNYEANRQNEAVVVSRTVPTDSLRTGSVKYEDANGNIVTLSPTDIANMDPNCSGLGTCPLGNGVNPAILDLFATYPHSNGTALGDGYNSGSYTFTSTAPLITNSYIARMDFNLNDKHRFYIRGGFQNDKQSNAEYYPGQGPASVSTDDSKGIAANYTWTISSNKVNNLRYGFLRQSFATKGVGQGSYVGLRGLSLPESNSRSSATLVPQHNIVDDFTYTKGKHTLQIGVNYRRFDYQNTSDSISYSSATSNAPWLVNSGIAQTGGSLDPGAFGYPDVGNSFVTNYDYAIVQAAGLISEETDHFNYVISADGKTAALQGQGTPVALSYRSNELEYYIQDAFRPMPNLTITFGIRHTMLQTPYETNGQQVQPTIDMHDWFTTRAAQAALGNTVQPEISFAPSGQARGGKPYYPMNWGNVAPRFSLAFSPAPEEGNIWHAIFGGAGKSSIRAGFGVYYDHYGQGLVANYARSGAFGLNTSVTNPASSLDADTSPRYSGLHNLPGLIQPAASNVTFPQTPSDDPYDTGFAITNGLDDRMKTPYSEAFNLSWQREMKGGLIFEADYVGRLGRHLLQSLDLAQPLNLVDKTSGMDYYTAATMLSKYVDEGRTSVPTIAYFENMFPDAAEPGTSTATQSIYDNLWQYVRGNETAGLYELDVDCSPACNNQTGRYWSMQYSSLFATSSMGSSSYHSGQFILRHPMKNSVQFDVSYTLSKSMDLGSDSESNANGGITSWGFILDAFNPRKNYAVSDFDTRHLLTADWVLQLPFGRGHAVAGNSNRLVNAIIGGWNFNGIARVSSSLPWSVYDSAGWTTNWEWPSFMVQTKPIKMRKHLDTNGNVQVFDNQTTALSSMRLPYPGEAGQRNKYRGDGYFDIDAGLHKSIAFTDRLKMQLAWEVFNVTNTPRFDPHSIDSGSGSGSHLGTYSSTLNSFRRMQISGRIEF